MNKPMGWACKTSMEVVILSLIWPLVLSLARSSPLFNASTLPEGTGSDNPLLSAVAGARVNITCEIFRISDGAQRQTVWNLIRDGADDVLLLFTDGLGQENFENFAVVEPERARLTILDYNTSFDNTQLGCGSTEVAAVFDLRIIKLPVLLNTSVETVTESDSFSLNAQVVAGFPLVPANYSWQLNDILIPADSSSPNISEYPVISFSSVQRNDSGIYTITATNDAGVAKGNFTLDVQYQPEGVAAQSTPLYTIADRDLTIVSYINASGNPELSSDWFINDDIISGHKYNASVTGQLTISLVSTNDTANYTNALENSVGMINRTVEVIVVEPPSMPRGLAILETSSRSVNISWINPLFPGDPVLEQFRISVGTFNKTVDAVNASDSNFVNTYIVEGLRPNTEYNLTIRSLSTAEQIGLLVSDQSEQLRFTTAVESPTVSIGLLGNVNGNLSLSWEVIETGGVDLETITVHCGCTSRRSSSSSEDSTALLRVVVDCVAAAQHCLAGSVSVGPVLAGQNYSCLVTANNSLRVDETRSNYVTAATGIPSQPVIVSASGGEEIIYLTLKVEDYGVLQPAEFSYIVSVFNYTDLTVAAAIRTITSDSLDTSVMSVSVDDLPRGVFLFTVVSSNSFGTSLDSILTDLTEEELLSKCSIQLVEVSGSATAGSRVTEAPDCQNGSFTTVGTTSGLVAVIVFQFLLLSAMITIFLICWKRMHCCTHCQSKANDNKAVKGSKEAYEMKGKEDKSGLISLHDNSAYGQMSNTNDQKCTGIVYETVESR